MCEPSVILTLLHGLEFRPSFSMSVEIEDSVMAKTRMELLYRLEGGKGLYGR